MLKLVIRLLIVTCLISSVPANAGDNIGRLFTTPAERTSLNYLRQIAKLQSEEQESPEQQSKAQADSMEKALSPGMPAEISMQGYVKRSDGKQGTVWINHQAMQENTANAEVRVGKMRADNNQVPLTLPDGKNLSLKVGQVYKPDNGSVSEVSARSSASKEITGTINDEVLANKPAIQNDLR